MAVLMRSPDMNQPLWPTFTGTTETVGSSPGGVTVHVDPAIGDPAIENAQALLAAVDAVVEHNNAIFGIDRGPIDVLFIAPYGTTAAERREDCDGDTVEVDACFGSPIQMVARFEAELSVAAMDGPLRVLSTGEALSRWCAAVVGSNALADFATAPAWAREGAANWVDTTAASDQHAESTGCGMAFISWLLSRGCTLSTIARAMVELGAHGTFAELYAALTGEPATSAWPAFKAALDGLDGVFTDDPFDGFAKAG